MSDEALSPSPEEEIPSTEEQDLEEHPVPIPRKVSFSKQGMVSTAHWCATEAGVEMLKEGGNAIDAAVASAFALGVCEPAASGLGGQTMILFYQAESKNTLALDGSSRAPHRALPGTLGKKERLRGHRATTIPSTPAVLAYVLSKYGTLPLSRILEPSIRLAEEGYPISPLQHSLTRRELKALRGGSASKFFLNEDGDPFSAGLSIRQPVLGDTFRLLAKHGVEDFYRGEISKRMLDDMDKHGGLLQADDLAQIPYPIERSPIGCRFEGHRVSTFPPPGAGRALVEMLRILSQFPEKLWTPDTPSGALLLTHVILRANRDRNDRPFDPNYYPQLDDKKMLTERHAKSVAREIRKQIKSQGETTHLSVTDKAGNAVALTQSIERVYGSCEAAPDLGFIYNNYISAFEHEDVSHPYYLRPNAIPWASVAPTIAFRDRRPWLVIGSPGSERITSTILQVMLRLRKQSPYDAVNGPRLHCSLSGTVSIEASRVSDDVLSTLQAHGFKIKERDPYSFYIGCAQLCLRERDGWKGVADPRRDGSAKGPE